ncbi:hypothetical protein ABFS83_12G090100 [Erythranthe nasuta]
MGKTKKEENSDDIEIISAGKLFTGSWEKKYWSSSRGKSRYPYPVGYKSARTQNGVTYTMEILEGLKGPSFVISSSDGKSCSGDTPDMAWESFQKKGCSKLWHGKRFSCKIDGAESFGFKNTLVQRLLRELVASVGDTAEQSFVPSNFSNECKPSSPGPDLPTCLVKPHVKGKRKMTDKVLTSKRLSKTPVNQHQQEKCTNNGSSSNSKQRDQPNRGSGGPSPFAGADEVSGFCHSSGVLELENLATVVENEKCLTMAERGKLDYLDHLEVGGSLSHEGKELSDRSRYGEVQGINNLTQQERSRVSNYQHDLPVVNDDDLCAPDTLDQAEDSSVSSLKNVQVNLIVKDAIVNDVGESEVLVPDSLPEGEIDISPCNTGSEKCDADSVSQELANSMMTLLLPRAVPLLKTFTRKKKKSAKPSKNPTHRSQEENNMPSISMNDATIDNGLAEHSDLDRMNAKACIPYPRHDSVIPTCGNSDSVVPDSFDNDVPQDPLPRGYSFGDKVPAIHASQMEGASRPESMISEVLPDICMPEDKEFADCDNSSLNLQTPSKSCCNMTENNDMNDESRSNIQQKVKLNNKLGGLFKLSGCYVHPIPISMVQLIVKENEIFIFVKCGYSEHKESTLFLYKALQSGERMGCPSLIGHMPIALQISKDVLGRDIAANRSLLQLTPDAQSIVLSNSIKTPCCREGKLHCTCPDCTSDICERNAVKIVRLRRGYASLVTKLETAQGVSCLLVCEPSFLLAAEADGKLKLWIMNSAWSGQKEDWYLPTLDWMFPTIMELKAIPKSAILVVGHNGFGEFALWDINKRNLVSRFSSPGMSVLECIPASFFRWQRKGECKTESIINDIMDATKTWFSSKSEKNHRFSPEDSDVAVWLLISTPSDPDSQCSQSCEQEANPVENWRLALLVNKTVITASVLDGGAAAVTSVGHGVVGKSNGTVYLWELSTGKKLGNLHSFKGSRVSCVATDTSESGALAIASADQLLVYMPA